MGYRKSIFMQYIVCRKTDLNLFESQVCQCRHLGLNKLKKFEDYSQFPTIRHRRKLRTEGWSLFPSDKPQKTRR